MKLEPEVFLESWERKLNYGAKVTKWPEGQAILAKRSCWLKT